MVMATFGVLENPILATKTNLAEITSSVTTNLENLAQSTDFENSISGRTISSIEAENKKNPPGQIQIISDSLTRGLISEPCDFETIHRNVRSQHVKFNFDKCDSAGSQFKLINKTNGYQAQIFALRAKGQLSTDYVQLRLGENELVFENRSSAGHVTTRLIKITRDH